MIGQGGNSAPDLGRVRRVLVVKLDEIGDFILATPFLRGLRASAPGATIVLAVTPLLGEMAASCPHVDAVVAAIPSRTTDTIELKLPRPDQPYHLERLREVMRLGGFDLAVVPRFDFDRYDGGRLARTSGARWVFGFSETVTPLKAQRNQGFDARFYTHVLARPATTHEVEQNLALLAHMGGHLHGGSQVEAYSTPEAEAEAERKLAAAAERFGVGSLIAVAPGSSYPAKEYPLSLLVPVVETVARHLNAGVVVLGSAPQAPMGEALYRSMPSRCLNLCGQLALTEAVAVIRRVRGLISMCSAPGHIAAAVGTPVAVFSCHPRDGDPEHFHAPERFRPWTRDDMALMLQPATTLGNCRGYCLAPESHCITGIDPGDAAERISAFLPRKAYVVPPRFN
ncbi:MAG: glycosyltransferase family 9 protein [Alphaproteobacteria bacterium]